MAAWSLTQLVGELRHSGRYAICLARVLIKTIVGQSLATVRLAPTSGTKADIREPSVRAIIRHQGRM